MPKNQNSIKGSIIINNEPLEYTLVISERKTIGLQINLKGELTIRANDRISYEKIDKIIKEKYKWILKTRKYMQEKYCSIPKIYFTNGSKVQYLGEKYILQIIYNNNFKKDIITIKGNYICITSRKNDEVYIEKIFNSWCRKNLKEIIESRVKYYGKYFEHIPKNIQVKEQKRRWGSCTYDNRLMFNWRLSRAPIEVIDYVVVHEMCHMEHKDHSKNFWRKVEKVMADYKEKSEWLKTNEFKLQWDIF